VSLSKAVTLRGLQVSEWALLIFGALLVVGLIGEYHKSWNRFLKSFELMVIIGVAGELIADGGIFAFSEHLQTIADIEISAANERAGKAEKDAADANERVGKAEERAAANAKEAARLNKLAEDEKLARRKLEARIADRHLTVEQQSRIAKSLCRFGGRNVSVGLYSPDSEMQTLAKEIAGALPPHCDGHTGWAVSIRPWQVSEGFSGIR
jgi:hypothetical protein